MLINIDGEDIVLRPAMIEDLGLPEVEGDHERFFVRFDHKGDICVRRAHTTKKAPDEGERPFFVKVGEELRPLSSIGRYTWCEYDGRDLGL